MNDTASSNHSNAEGLIPDRPFKDWPIVDPTVLIATCMKNEGPFILEWVAWHKAVGVTHFVVYTNDCTDGTTEILDRLQELGHIVHLPNPAVEMGSPRLQPIALHHVHTTTEFSEVDFFISMDVDEFVNIRCGGGTLPELFEVVGEFDVLSMSELNHGSNGRESFESGWMTELFPKHQTEKPGRWKAGRGVKSITRVTSRVQKIRNHRPDVDKDAIWLDGSGRQIDVLHQDQSRNGVDCRGTYELVVLDHFPLRSLDSYLIKMDRGDVVVKGKRVSHRYWRMRNQNGEITSDLGPGMKMAREVYRRDFMSDPQLMQLQGAAEKAHMARISTIVNDEVFRDRKKWIFENSWP